MPKLLVSRIECSSCLVHMHQARFVIDADVGLHAKVILVALLGLVHLRVTLAILVLGRARRVDQRRVDDGALAQLQAAVTQIAVDYR